MSCYGFSLRSLPLLCCYHLPSIRLEREIREERDRDAIISMNIYIYIFQNTKIIIIQNRVKVHLRKSSITLFNLVSSFLESKFCTLISFAFFLMINGYRRIFTITNANLFNKLLVHSDNILKTKMCNQTHCPKQDLGKHGQTTCMETCMCGSNRDPKILFYN